MERLDKSNRFTQEFIDHVIEQVSQWNDAFKVSDLAVFFGRSIPYKWARQGEFTAITTNIGECANKAEVINFLERYKVSKS